MMFSKNALCQAVALATSMIYVAGSPAAEVEVNNKNKQNNNRLRNMSPQRELGPGAPKVTKTIWNECVTENMDVSDCATMIRRDAKRHEIPDLEVKVVKPRTKEEIKNTYMKVGIAVNVDGIVTGDRNDGQITYPFTWVSATHGKTRMLGPWDCTGLTSWECCQTIREDVPDMDIHGNHIQCFAHLNELVPDVRVDRPVYEKENLAYFTFVYDQSSGRYREQIFSPQQVAAIAAREQAALEAAEANLNTVLANDSITVGELLQLEADLMEATSPLGDAQNLLGDIENVIETATMGADIGTLNNPAQTPPDAPVLQTAVPTTPKSTLADIMTAVHHLIHDYSATNIVTEKHIWIYASHNDKVKRAPQIGGTFDGHEEALKNIPGYEDYEVRTYDRLTGGARYLRWKEVYV